MEKSAAEKEFSKFLKDECLNSNQIDFVDNVVNYIVKNSSIEKEVLQKDPFNRNGGEVALFKDKANIVKDIVSTIDKVNERLSL